MTGPRTESAGWRAYALVVPALAVIALFFALPLVLSAVLAFRGKDGGLTFEHFAKAWDLYQTDLLFTVGIVLLSTALIGAVAVAIAGYLTLGENPRAVALLRWLYRWPLFIPFIVTGQIMSAALKYKLPTIAVDEAALEAGALARFGGSDAEFKERNAAFIDRILRGAKPADLPIEQPTKFELGFNLKTAKALGITVPPTLLLRADQVIQ